MSVSIRLLLLGGLSWLLLSQCSPAASPPPRPNVLFILVDDLGWTDVGAFGSTFYETPHIDRLAATGMKFEQGYAASPVCSPTRSSIMTGKNPARTQHTQYFGGPQPADVQPGHWSYRAFGTRPLLPAEYLPYLPHSDTTLAEAFQAAGYKTFFAGKWHLGDEAYFPEHQGFDINKGGIERGGPYGGDKYFSPYGNPRLPDGPPGEHLPDRLARETAAFIEAHQDTPFLAYLAFYSVHTPLMARPDLEAKYQRKKDSLGLEDQWAPWGPEPGNRTRLVQCHPVYAAMVEAMDQAVGVVLDQLEALGLADNTVVVFMSDNGGLATSEGHPTANLPLRAGKGWLYEGGIREPLIVRWPGHTAPGSTCTTPVISTDFYPTLLEIAGLPLQPGQHLDGRSFVPLLEGRDQPHETLLGWHYPHYSNQGETPGTAFRQGDWKLIHRYEADTYELFNLATDREEQHDLAAENPERVAALRAAMQAWLDASGARYPTPNPQAP